MKISVILLAHNEEANIGWMIRGLRLLYSEKISGIIVVDDASVDSTERIVRIEAAGSNKVKLISKQPPCGVGFALKRGCGRLYLDYALSLSWRLLLKLKIISEEQSLRDAN